MNKKALRKTADLLEASPAEKYDQDSWGHNDGCGTVACLAGWALMANGYESVEAKAPRETRQYGTSCEYVKGRRRLITRFIDPATKRKWMVNDAIKVLGLEDAPTVGQIPALFDGGGRGWPEKYREAYKKAYLEDNPECMKTVAVQLLRDLADGKVALEDCRSEEE